MTNKIVLRTIEEFMQDYTPIYQPLYPLFTQRKSQSYSEEVGELKFKRLNAIGDIRSRHFTPKDTIIKQINAKEQVKLFKKYFLASQYVQSSFQDRDGVEDVIAQVLDEHHRHMDELFLYGEGTQMNDTINNGLYYSGDSNYKLEESVAIDGSGGKDPLISLHARVMANVAEADLIRGQKVILFYGTTVTSLFDGVYAATSTPFKRVLQDVLGSNYQLGKIPADVTPTGANGWIIANLDQVKTHYTTLPVLKAQGVNEELMHVWSNFVMGSIMLEVLVPNAVIRQPATLST